MINHETEQAINTWWMTTQNASIPDLRLKYAAVCYAFFLSKSMTGYNMTLRAIICGHETNQNRWLRVPSEAMRKWHLSNQTHYIQGKSQCLLGKSAMYILNPERIPCYTNSSRSVDLWYNMIELADRMVRWFSIINTKHHPAIYSMTIKAAELEWQLYYKCRAITCYHHKDHG